MEESFVLSLFKKVSPQIIILEFHKCLFIKKCNTVFGTLFVL